MLFILVRIVDVEKSLQKGVQVHRLMSRASEDDRPLEAELEVRGWTEGEHLRMNIGMVWVRMPLQAAIEKVVAQRPGHPRDKWNMQRLDPVDAERIDVLRVVCPRDR